jgi:hypothetical protein
MYEMHPALSLKARVLPKFGVSDVGSELCIMEQLFDYQMVENRPVVEQAHEIQALAKELE